MITYLDFYRGSLLRQFTLQKKLTLAYLAKLQLHLAWFLVL